MNYIVLDLEFNQFFDFKHKSLQNPIKNCPFEIIQIGAVKLDTNFNILEKQNFYIKSKIYKRIHPFVQKITKINSQLLKDKPEFKDVYPNFVNFVSGAENVFCVWGDCDITALLKNISYYNLDEKCLPKNYINVQSLASSYLKQPSGLTIGLKNAIEKLDLHMDTEFHNALNDAVYTAKALQILKQEILPQHFKPLIKNEKPVKHKGFNSSSLYSVVEKEFGRKLTKKEKEIVKNIYLLGKKGVFDYK
jgi:DNA polymerase III epsilon subunit-like protein